MENSLEKQSESQHNYSNIEKEDFYTKGHETWSNMVHKNMVGHSQTWLNCDNFTRGDKIQERKNLQFSASVDKGPSLPRTH